MKLQETWIQIEPNKKETQACNVISVQVYMDSFGKLHIETKPFESFSQKKFIYRDKDRLEAQASNCFKSFVGWKL